MEKTETMKDTRKNLQDSERREFMEKFGKLSGAIPVGMLVLMSPSQSKASSSNGAGGNDNAP